MRQGVAIGLAGLVSVYAIAAAAAVKGVATPASHVAKVEVVEHDSAAPPGFADMVRDDALKEAALFGADGAAITLKVEIDKVHFKNAMKAMFLGDDNYAMGHVAVVDAASGQVLGTFKFWVNAERPGVGMRVLTALDPTGLVGMSQAMSRTDVSKEQVVMAANFARETLRQTYGDARSKAVHAAASSTVATAAPVSSSAPVQAAPASAQAAASSTIAAAASSSAAAVAMAASVNSSAPVSGGPASAQAAASSTIAAGASVRPADSAAAP